jgi:nitroimidazol reductase NimA-like FMN-containing flavoprotein (pyridoxamine 5'-phosphate oxidase superfamily)
MSGFMANTVDMEKINLFLARHRVGHMGTVDEHGYPHVMPMWHTVFEGLLYISYRALGKKKHANLLGNPKMSYTVDAGDDVDSYRGVLIQGDAEFVVDVDTLRRYQIAWTDRHFGNDDDPYYRKLTSVDRMVIRLIPVNVVTWGKQSLVL